MGERKRRVLVLDSPLLASLWVARCQESGDFEDQQAMAGPAALAAPRLPTIHEFDAVLIDLGLEMGSRSRFSGLEVAKALRRGAEYRGALVFVGFRRPKRSLAGPGVPGSAFVPLPATGKAVSDVLRDTETLPPELMDGIVYEYCVREDARDLVHTLANLFIAYDRWAALGEQLELDEIARSVVRALDDLAGVLRRYKPVGAELVETIKEAFAKPASSVSSWILGLREQLSEIDRMVSGGVQDGGKIIGSGLVPSGWESLLIADDDGFPPECVLYLEKQGYVVDVVTSVDEAMAVLRADPSVVFLSDQTFGLDSGAGRRLMAEARRRPQCRLIVAMSSASLDVRDVPEADLVFSGPTAKTLNGVRRMHGAICKWATEQR